MPAGLAGGKRIGSGGKKGVTAEDYLGLLKERTRHEKAKADLASLEARRRLGELIARPAVEQAGATLVAALVQTVRSIPDNLERKAGLPPAAVEEAERIIDAACQGLADRLKELGGW